MPSMRRRRKIKYSKINRSIKRMPSHTRFRRCRSMRFKRKVIFQDHRVRVCRKIQPLSKRGWLILSRWLTTVMKSKWKKSLTILHWDRPISLNHLHKKNYKSKTKANLKKMFLLRELNNHRKINLLLDNYKILKIINLQREIFSWQTTVSPKLYHLLETKIFYHLQDRT